MSEPPLIIESLDGCEDYIAKYMEGRDLRFTDKRQVRQTEQHRKRLEKVLKTPEVDKKKELRHRVSTDYIFKSSKCNNHYVNNTHFFYGNGSRLGHDYRGPLYALDFPENTQLNRTDFTEHLQTLATRQSNIDKEWLRIASNRLEPRKTARSNSTPPNLKFTSPEVPAKNDRFEMGFAAWHKQKFAIRNFDKNLDRPTNLGRLLEPQFERCVILALSGLIENIDLQKLRPGFQPIQSILFTTFDNYFYAVLPSKLDDVRRFSNYWSKKVKYWTERPNDSREKWQRKSVILFLEQFEEDQTQFRRARHMFHLESEKEDWFIEMDTGEFRRLENAGPNNVMSLPGHQCTFPNNIIECRFSDMDMSQFKIAQEIDKIRKNGVMNIVGFDKMERRYVPSIQYKSDIRTAIIEPIKSPPRPLMTTVFCDNLSCMGCNTWSTFQKPSTLG